MEPRTSDDGIGIVAPPPASILVQAPCFELSVNRRRLWRSVGHIPRYGDTAAPGKMTIAIKDIIGTLNLLGASSVRISAHPRMQNDLDTPGPATMNAVY